MTKYIFFMLLMMSNVIYSMEYITPETLFQDSSPQDAERNASAKRKLPETIDDLVEMPWRNLRDNPIKVQKEPEMASYRIRCSHCGEKTSLHKAKFDHLKKCPFRGKKIGWEIMREPTTQYEVQTICPYITDTCKNFTGHYLLWQVARMPDSIKLHIEKQHPDKQQLTMKDIKQRVRYRQSAIPGKVKEIKTKMRSKKEFYTLLKHVDPHLPNTTDIEPELPLE